MKMMQICWRKHILTYVAICMPVLAFVAFYLAREDLIYMWDYSGYHSAWIDCVRCWRERGLSVALSQILQSIREYDYNNAALLPLLPWGRLFGCTRFSYLAAMACIYLVPSGMLIAEMIFALLKPRFAFARRGLVYAIVFSSAPFWCPFLRGFVDVAVLLPLTVATWIFLKDSFVTKRRLGAALALGCCLYLGFLFRRWMAFSLIAFSLAALPFVIADFFAKGMSFRQKAANVFLHGLCAGVGFALPMVVLQWEKIVSIAGTNYSVAHAAWSAPLAAELQFLSSYLNPCVLIFLALGGILFLLLKRWECRAFLFCGLYVAVYVVSFLRLEMIGRHHSYGFLPHFLFLLVAGCLALAALLTRWRKLQIGFCILVCSGLSLLWVMSFVPTPQKRCDRMFDPLETDSRSGVYTSLPFRYAGNSSLIRFVYRFEELMSLKDDARYANLGCGFTINSYLQTVQGELIDEMICANCLRSTRSRGMMIDPVDCRTPIFPAEVLNADYLVVVSPFEGHCDFCYHQIYYRLCKALVSETTVGQAYERVLEQPILPQCIDDLRQLEDPVVRERLAATQHYVDYRTDAFVAPTDMKLLVYRRKRSVSDSEKAALADEILKYIHPSLKAQFAASIVGSSFFANAEMKYDHSSNYELVRHVSSDTVAMHPWTTPSTLTLHPNGRYRSVHLDFSSQNVQGDVMFSILRDGVEFRREHVLGGQKVGLDLPLADVKTLVFSVDCNGSVNYDSCVLTVSDIQLKEEE